jgi:hypothetical protein
MRIKISLPTASQPEKDVCLNANEEYTMIKNKMSTHFQKMMILMVLAALFVSAFGSAAATPALAQGAGVQAQNGEDIDLVISLEVYPPDQTKDENYYVVDDITVELTVENLGTDPAGAYRVLLCVNPVVLPCSEDNDNVDYVADSTGLEADLGQNLREIWSVTFNAGYFLEGSHTVVAVVDSDGQVTETCDNCEGNNTASKSFLVITSPVDAPDHDDILFAKPIVLVGGVTVVETELDVVGATRDLTTDPTGMYCSEEEPNLEAGLRSVWYTYEPEENQSLVLSTYSTEYDTYIVVWQGLPDIENHDNQIGCNEDYESILEGGAYSTLYMSFEAGKTYYIVIAQYTRDETNMDEMAVTSAGVGAQSLPGYTLNFTVSTAVVVSGNAGTAGATLSYLEETATKSVTSDLDGNYSIIVPSDWSGTVTPSKSGFVFLPENREYTTITTDMTAENYSVRETFHSVPAQDGWVLESGEFTNVGGKLNKGAKVLYVGDDALNRQYRSILSFDTASLPDNAEITKVTLTFRHAGITETTPFKTHGKLLVDMRNGPFSLNPALQKSDFSAAASKQKALVYTKATVAGWYTRLLSATYYPLVNRTGVTQFRLRFAKDDNNNLGADYLKISSGNAGTANAPKLIIEYNLPTP